MRNPLVPGLAPKPDQCLNTCPRAFSEGIGFVADWVGNNPKIALVLDKPTRDECTSRLAFTSGYSRFFFAAIGRELGLTKENLIVSYCLRCYSYEYPVGINRQKAEKNCRNWDNKSADRFGLPTIESGLIKWNPNLFMVTFGLDDCLEMSRSETAKSDAYHFCMLEDFKKAMRFAASGYRPCVLMGQEPMNLFPFTNKWAGGVRNWRGTWWEGSWPFTPEKAKVSYDKPPLKLYLPQTQPAPTSVQDNQMELNFG